MESQVLEVNDKNFKDEVLQSNQPVIIDFWAPWCMPCRMVVPIMNEAAAEYGDRVKFAKYNIDENSSIPAKYGIMAIPTLLFFKNGELVGTNVGVMSKEELTDKIEELFA